MAALVYGVGCHDCGCKLERATPEFWPDDVPKGDMKKLERYVTTVAVMAWNSRAG